MTTTLYISAVLGCGRVFMYHAELAFDAKSKTWKRVLDAATALFFLWQAWLIATLAIQA